MKKFLAKYSILLILVIMGLGLQWKYLNEFPSHIHAWAQSDRYALALGFIRNEFDFFRPETYVLNHQFPGSLEFANKSTITAVDFPIHDYMASLFMNLFGSTAPWCFRLYILTYSLIGLFFLYKTCELLLNDKILSILVVILASTSRVFVYYQAGFLPSVPSLSNAFIAVYFYVNYLKTHSRKSFCWSIFFLTLAGMSRLPFAILLLGIIIFEAFQSMMNRKADLWKWVTFLISILFIGLYFLFNRHLQNKYGSIFLNYALPPRNFHDFRIILKQVITNWVYQYFTKVHYLIFIILTIMTLLTFFLRRNVLQKIHKQLLVIFVLFMAGVSVYSILMIQQFPAHDYYFLDTFYLPVILFFVILVSILSVSYKVLRYTTMIILFFACILVIPRAVKSQEKRRLTGNWDHTETTIQNFMDSKTFLASAKVPDAAKILVIDAYAPNIPFILMNRTGFAVLTTSRENIDKALKWDFDYIVIQDDFLLSEVVSNYPELIERIERLASNGKITLYRMLPEPKQQTLYSFLGLKDKIPVSVERCAFEPVDSVWNKHWKKIRLTNEVNYNGRASGFVNEKQEFGLTYILTNPGMFRDSARLVFFKGQFFRNKDLKGCSIIASVAAGDKSLFYNAYELQDLITKSNQWQEVNLFFRIPKIEEKDFKLKIYIWNQGRNTLYYDDTEVSIY